LTDALAACARRWPRLQPSNHAVMVAPTQPQMLPVRGIRRRPASLDARYIDLARELPVHVRSSS